jgi:hypothetical protein
MFSQDSDLLLIMTKFEMEPSRPKFFMECSRGNEVINLNRHVRIC